MNGRLSEHPLTELLREISDAGLSGALRLARARVKAVIYAQDGEIVYARSNLRTHRLVECAQRSNLVEGKRLPAVITEMMSDAEAGAALIKSGALTSDGLTRLRVWQVLDTLRSLMPMTDGEWSFDGRARLAEDVGVRFDLRQLLLEGTRRLPAEFAVGRFSDAEELISPAPSQPVHLQLLPIEGFVLSRVDAPARLDELIALCAMPAAETMHAIYTLVLCGFLSRTKWRRALAADSRAQRAATTAGASGTSTAVKKAGTEEGANAPRVSEAPSAPPPETPSAPPEPAAEIEALIARARADDYYDMLGVAHHADKSDVKRAYYALAKRFHPDRFRRAADADTLSRIEGAFAEIARAYETLREPRERASYDSKLAAQSSQRGGQATGEGRQSRDSAEGSGASQSRAEESFQQGLAATQRGDVAAAALHFGEAVRLSPQQARYHALYGRALMADTHARRQAEAELRAAMTLDPQNASYHVALAELYIMIGLQRRAKGELERALSLDPQNTAAKRMLERMKGK